MEFKYANVILVFEDGSTEEFKDFQYINRRKLIDKVTFMTGDERMSLITNIIVQPLEKSDKEKLNED